MAKKQEFTYEQIEPLVVFQETDGRNVYVEFALPGSQEVFESKANIKKSNDVGSKVKRRVASVATSQARMVASRAIRGVVGGGIVGRLSTTAVNTASQEVRPGQGPTEDEIQEAIVTAFMRVKDNFHFDTVSGEWGKPLIAPPPPPKSPFEEQITAHPIADPHDKNVFARAMAELAYADGTISKEEAELFKSIIPPDQPSLDRLAKADPVSKVEAEEVTQGVKATIYMLSWVIALIDLDMNPVEEELLMEYADVFALPDNRREELIKFAKFYVMEQNIDPDEPREELFQIADKIKLNHDDAERCRIAYKRRVG
jgi:tellurite resistance protein